MKTVISGCGIPILLFAGFFAGYAQVFVPRFEPDWLNYIFAGVCTLTLCLAIGAVKAS